MTGGNGAADGRPPDLGDPTGVRETYDRIAGAFDETRHHPWPETEAFVSAHAPSGGLALDIGCGNGRNAPVLGTRADRVVGIDLSRHLLSLATERTAAEGTQFDPLQATATAVPLRSGVVDVAVYIAAVHHLGSRAARVASLDELARVLAPGAPALVSAWSVAADRFDEREGFDTTVGFTLDSGETVDRYYHIYDRAEFGDELAASGLTVDEQWMSSGNCYARVRAPASGGSD